MTERAPAAIQMEVHDREHSARHVRHARRCAASRRRTGGRPSRAVGRSACWRGGHRGDRRPMGHRDQRGRNTRASVVLGSAERRRLAPCDDRISAACGRKPLDRRRATSGIQSSDSSQGYDTVIGGAKPGMLAALVGAASLGACDNHDDTRVGRDAFQDAAAKVVTRQTDRPRSKGPVRRASRRVVRAPDGTPGIIAPAAPRYTVTRPSAGCVTRDGVKLPPTPGITSRPANEGSVAIRYRVAHRSAGCVPVALRLTVQTLDGRKGSITKPYALDRLTGSILIEKPPQFAGAIQVVRASTVSSSGTRSLVTAVRVTSSRR
jgi:hypothetical protein